MSIVKAVLIMHPKTLTAEAELAHTSLFAEGRMAFIPH